MAAASAVWLHCYSPLKNTQGSVGRMLPRAETCDDQAWKAGNLDPHSGQCPFHNTLWAANKAFTRSGAFRLLLIIEVICITAYLFDFQAAGSAHPFSGLGAVCEDVLHGNLLQKLEHGPLQRVLLHHGLLPGGQVQHQPLQAAAESVSERNREHRLFCAPPCNDCD